MSTVIATAILYKVQKVFATSVVINFEDLVLQCEEITFKENLSGLAIN